MGPEPGITMPPTRPPHATQTRDLVICNLGHCLAALPTQPPRVTQWFSNLLVTTLDIVWPHYRLGHHASPSDPVIRWSPPWTLSDRTTNSATTRHPVIQWFAGHHLGHCLTALPTRPPRVAQWSSDLLVTTLDIVWPHYRLGHHASPSDPVIRWSPPWTLSDRATDSATTRHPVIQWFAGHHLGHCLTALPTRPPRVTQWSSDLLVTTLDIVWPHYRLGHHASPSDPVICCSPPWTLSDRTTDSATTRHPLIQWFAGHHLGHCLTALPTRPPRVT